VVQNDAKGHKPTSSPLRRVDAAASAPTIFSSKRERVLGREQRKFAAIVAADMVGYSKPHADEVTE
jgi:hypothetical protein